ncbi:hypothetical protein ACIBCT_07465 [Streptosporangium sp. NPDC050855]|uniref:hypothetical protein n=1 Tax=Streptosporangium sp. NPDC050855 TaxID=3366194 RepID=UPI0037B17743
MVRLVKRALVPARLRRAVLGWFDARYISRADHRQDVKDALWEVRTLAREVTSLRAEVADLRAQVARVRPDPARAGRWDDAHRLAQETAVALEEVLRNEVLLWQAVDRVTAEPDRAAGPERTPEPARTPETGPVPEPERDRRAAGSAGSGGGTRATGSAGSTG